MQSSKKLSLDLAGKPDFDQCMNRVNAWFENDIVDRVPVRFSSFDFGDYPGSSACELKNAWMDTEAVIHAFIKRHENAMLIGETFPVFWPNLGPSVYSAFFGPELTFGPSTSWSHPCIDSESDIDSITFDESNPYLRKIEEITDYALERCSGRFMVGYTDIHAGMDCVADWSGGEKLCLNLYDNAAIVTRLLALADSQFHPVFDRFDRKLKASGQMSVNWLGIPSFGRLHVPSCDFASMISVKQFEQFCLPGILDEMRTMTENVFHLDGPAMIKHLDCILEIPEINAIQWVQGQGLSAPIMQWVGLIKKIRAAGKGVVVTLMPGEVSGFTEAVRPEGIFLWVVTDKPHEQKEIIKILNNWK